VAYRTDVNARDKGGAIVAVIAVHAALLFALLNLSGTIELGVPQSALSTIDLANPPPPRPPPPQQRARPRAKEAAAAPANVRSQATPVVAPKPRIVTPPVQKIVASNTPRQGNAATQGASDLAGPGTGAGGAGNGTGSGNGGNGSGGGDNGVADPPHLATPVLSGRDIPRDLLDQWPPGVPVFLRIRVNPQGFVSECNVLRGTGNREIDAAMCNIAHDRLRFRPAVNRSGQAVAGWFGYAQRPPR
jgi:protein TonB